MEFKIIQQYAILTRHNPGVILMSEFECPYEPTAELFSPRNAYFMLQVFLGLSTATLLLAKAGEANNQLHFDSRLARIISGLLNFQLHLYHTSYQQLSLPENEAALVAAVPHRTGWEALVIAAAMKGRPPRFFATTDLNWFPGVTTFFNMFKVIPIQTNVKNNAALETAGEILKNHGCVALFPQGGFSTIGQEPPRIFPGTAKLALANQVPVHVVRLDGHWSLQNPTIPLFVSNNTIYRAFLSWFHPNNVQVRRCFVIDFHLKSENASLTDEQKMQEINAELYAFARHTYDLSNEDLDAIKQEIADQRHIPIWQNKLAQDKLKKDLKQLTKPYVPTTMLDKALSLFAKPSLPQHAKDKIARIQQELEELQSEGKRLGDLTLESDIHIMKM